MKYAGIKNFVLQAVGERFCTVEGMLKFIEPQIKAEINKADFDAVLHRMCSDGDLVKADNGGFSAYFPADKIPTSFFRAGSGKINALYDGEKAGLPVTLVAFDGAALPVEEIAVIPYFTEDQLALIENLTAKFYTTREVAGELSVDEYLFARRARHDLATRAAIARGWKRKEEPDSTETSSEREKKVELDEPARKPPRLRVADIRPFARLATPPEADAPVKMNRPLSLKRLCRCGNPLGARVKECRECWLKLKQPEARAAAPENESKIDRKIREAVREAELEPEKLSEILTGVFLEFAPVAVKEKFVEKLFEELLEESRAAAA